MDTRKQARAEAIEVRDTIRGALQLLGGQPDDVKMEEDADGRPEIVLKLSGSRARFVAEQMDTSYVRSNPIPGMVLWSEQRMRVGQVECCVNEWVTLRPLRGGATWRSPIGDLRPALMGEIDAALKMHRDE